MTRPFAAQGFLMGSEPLPLDRSINLAYPKLAMKRFRLSRVAYLVLLAAEVLKIAGLSGPVFSASGGGITDSAAFEHAGLAALCLAPVMLFMLAANERAFAFCLPLLAIGKGASLLSFAFLAIRAGLSISFAARQVSNFSLIFCAIMLCVVDDLASLIFCLCRRRKLCG